MSGSASSPALRLPEIRTGLRARYAETDAMGVVHHAVYPVWFEVGRSDLMRELGLPYSDLEARGYYLMLSGLSVAYRRAARYDEELELLTRVGTVRSRALTFTYELRRGDERLATGETQHVVTDHGYRPLRLPADALALLGGSGVG